MPRYFLDTSALAKVYRKELGSDLMDRIVVEPGSQRFISRFTILEMESVLALKFRTGEIDEHSLLAARRRLEADLSWDSKAPGRKGKRRAPSRSSSTSNRSWPNRGASRPGCLAVVGSAGPKTGWFGNGVCCCRPEALPGSHDRGLYDAQS